MAGRQWNQKGFRALLQHDPEQKTVSPTQYAQNSNLFCIIKKHLPSMYTFLQKPLKFTLYPFLK